jgi:hypothetical protein
VPAPADDSRLRSARARDGGLRRLRRLTIASTAVATALTGAFAGLGAASLPGRTVSGAAPTTRPRPVAHRARRAEAPAPTPTLPAEGASEAPAPPPAPAPVASSAPPVVVSGGS